MKKFCSDCGQPLEVSKKFCSDCGTSNPYFSVSHEASTDGTGVIDELRARKESIERELQEIEREQNEAQNRETMQKEMEELRLERVARLNKEKEIKERFERAEIEAGFKKEISQVREENELYKQHTHNLLVELRDVIVQIDEENKRLKEEVKQIVKTRLFEQRGIKPVEETPPFVTTEMPGGKPATEEITQIEETPVVEELVAAPVIQEEIQHQEVIHEPAVFERMVEEQVAAVVEEYATPTAGAHVFESYTTPVAEVDDSHPFAQAEAETKSKGMGKMVAVAVCGFLAISIGLGVYLYRGTGAGNSNVPPAIVTEQATTEPGNTDNTNGNETEATTSETASMVPAAASSSVSENSSDPSAEENTKPISIFGLTTGRAKADLVGKTLSGCGITLASADEVSRMSIPQLIEKADRMGYVKYKLDMHVKQAGTTYHVTPYMYYTTGGKFMRVDAANCE